MPGDEPSALSLTTPDVVGIQVLLDSGRIVEPDPSRDEVYHDTVADNISETFLSTNIRTASNINPNVKSAMTKQGTAIVACHVFVEGTEEQGRQRNHVSLTPGIINGYKT